MTRRIALHEVVRGLRPLLLVGALAAAGCTASSLSSMQGEFDHLQTAQAACEDTNAKAAPGMDPERCLASFDQPMLDLAQQARRAADTASDPRTRIAFLRLAAMAGWQSRSKDGLDLTDAVAAEGTERCAALDPKTYGTPRDCALLRVAPAFARHIRATSFLIDLKSPAEGFDPQTRAELRAQSQTYVANTWDVIEGARADFTRNGELSPSVLTYLDHQRLAIYCTTAKLAQLDAEAGFATLSDDLLREIDGKMTGPFGRTLRPENCTPDILKPQ